MSHNSASVPAVPLPAAAAPDAPDYRRTAARRIWAELPTLLQERAAAHLDGRVTGVRLAGGGFTPGFRQAAPESDALNYPSYLREARVLPLMPPDMPLPALRTAEHLAVDGTGWQLPVHKAVDGTMPGHPWTDRDLRTFRGSSPATRWPMTSPYPHPSRRWRMESLPRGSSPA